VACAAKHGQTALDGDGGNSPFAVAFAQRIATPNVEINKLFRLVRDDVMEATAGRQEPYTYGSLPGREDFYFLAKQPTCSSDLHCLVRPKPVLVSGNRSRPAKRSDESQKANGSFCNGRPYPV
jgi:hypothetical protein